MIYSLLQHIQQSSSQSLEEATMSQFFAGNKSKSPPDDQKQTFTSEPSEVQSE